MVDVWLTVWMDALGDAWHAMFLTRAHTADLLYIYTFTVKIFYDQPDSAEVWCVLLSICVCVCVYALLLTTEGKVVQTEAEYADQHVQQERCVG